MLASSVKNEKNRHHPKRSKYKSSEFKFYQTSSKRTSENFILGGQNHFFVWQKLSKFLSNFLSKIAGFASYAKKNTRKNAYSEITTHCFL